MTQLFDLHPATDGDESRHADLPTAGLRTTSSGTWEGKPDIPLTVEEWAEQMAPFFHAASQIAPGFGGGRRGDGTETPVASHSSADA